MDRKILISLGALLDTRDNPSVLVDAHYRIIAANKAYCDSYGVSPESVVGKTCHEVSHRSAEPCHQHGEQCPHREVFERGQSSEVLHMHFDFNQKPDYVRIRAHPLHDESGERFLLESIQRLAPRVEMDVDAYRLAGKSPAFLQFFSQLASVARTGVTVWLHGEGGTGKGLAARFIHEHSARKQGPFVSFNCAERSPEDCEAGLFAAADGNPGTPQSNAGAFERARGGTLYLDAFEALPLTLQGKFLRMLDGTRALGTSARAGDVRLVVASQANLARMMAEGTFRQDLYYRIAEFPIRVPALRERQEDIPLIAESLLEQIAQETGRACRLSPSAVEALCGHAFPGNLRELRSLLLGAATRCQAGLIEAGDLDFIRADGVDPVRARRAASAARRPPPPQDESDAPLVASGDEAETIRGLLKRYGSRRAVAKKLGVSVPTLYRKLKQLGIINLGLATLSVLTALHAQHG